jgi:probable F420-dependent oxidoreductase
MRAGFAVGNIGPIGTEENVRRIAQRAEELGYHSLNSVERLLWPVEPQTPYPVSADGSLPVVYRHNLDPLDVLTFVAPLTKTVKLRPSVLDIPYYNPVMLARRLATIDQLSGGRLEVGFGLGWSADEYQAAGAEFKDRGARADEFLQLLKAIWTSNPVEHRGRFYTVPRSVIQSKPVQQPHPPIYMAAFAPAALHRIARLADGWNPVAIPVAGMQQMFDGLKQMAQAAGRDPASLKLIVRANVEITERPLGDQRGIFTGTLEQIREDVEGCRAIGADEVHFDPTFMPDAQQIDRWLEVMERVRPLV